MTVENYPKVANVGLYYEPTGGGEYIEIPTTDKMHVSLLKDHVQAQLFKDQVVVRGYCAQPGMVPTTANLHYTPTPYKTKEVYETHYYIRIHFGKYIDVKYANVMYYPFNEGDDQDKEYNNGGSAIGNAKNDGDNDNVIHLGKRQRAT
ncbi:unnamed protein product [Prorocentrum cordatum]|uniref:Transmembrane 9 superfamily member n=1 Tax=Prorocentrum cordatum TaxID=2364126 RepID=A0ABN9Y8F9_9DINO|nr:unnamed protein product [Polarella glacialis]